MSLSDHSRVHNGWPHRVAIVLACATFPLILVGGMVTSYDAGMAVPDWPSTYGYNLFLYPWQTWLFGPFDLLIEHGHRLLGAAVGFLAMAFVLSVFRWDHRRWMRTAASLGLLMVIMQGVLGGARVRLDERGLAMIHGCFGLATFAYLGAMAVVTSRYWAEQRQLAGNLDTQRLKRLSLLTSLLVYLQTVLGALLRHVPVLASPRFFQIAVMFHLLVGFAVAVHVVLVARVATRPFRAEPRIVGPAAMLLGLVALQLVLGCGTWILKYGWPAWFSELPLTAGFTVSANSLWQAMVSTAHVAVGALMLMVSVTLSLRVARFFRPVAVTAGSGAFYLGCTG